jgi:hypothetical protein
LIERVRGSRFRAAPEHREDFARADRQLQRSTDRTGLARAASANRQTLVVAAQRANTKCEGSRNRGLHLKAARWSVGVPALSHVANSKRFLLKSLDVLLSAPRYPTGNASLFAAHGATLIVLFASVLSFVGQRKNVRRIDVESYLR